MTGLPLEGKSGDLKMTIYIFKRNLVRRRDDIRRVKSIEELVSILKGRLIDLGM